MKLNHQMSDAFPMVKKSFSPLHNGSNMQQPKDVEITQAHPDCMEMVQHLTAQCNLDDTACWWVHAMQQCKLLV